jgi:lipopolysaccharide transport system ATP-binding protein
MSWAIQVENLGKKYRRGGVAMPSSSFRETVAHVARQTFTKLNPLRRSVKMTGRHESTEFWALRGVSLEVQEGEILGIIGPNGAGKSTLLKIMSRITDPTHGTVRYRGRVASLLEVGTGFHRELTGRENIFLNGAILGMRRAEIRSKLGEIAAFSGVEKFLDTPVKFYSSGMYLRLAFSVAAHLQADILLVDEVLAVGDAAFQEKCIGKMKDVTSHSGRTVIFVSHNMDAVHKLCPKTVLVQKGKVAFDGPTGLAIEQYFGTSELQKRRSLAEVEGRAGSGEARYTEVELLGGKGESRCEYTFDSSIRFRAAIHFSKPMENPSVGYNIFSGRNIALVDARSHWDGFQLGRCEGKKILEVTIPPLNFYPGIYTIQLWVSPSPTLPVMDYVENGCSFRLIPPHHIPQEREFFDIWGAVHVQTQWKLIEG